MSKIDLARENEQLRAAYQRARTMNPAVAIITCVLCVGIGWLLAGGTLPAVPWPHAPAAPVPTPHVVIREISTPLPVYALPPAQAAPAQERCCAPVSAATPVPVVRPVGIKVIVVRPSDGGAPIVVRDGTKYRGKP